MSQPIRTRGINHLALVCRDMAETVEFYERVLGMRLVKTIELPGGMGQHFFLDAGNDTCLAFFWFPTAPPPAPGVGSAATLPDRGDLTTATASMNHVAFDVAPEQFDECRERLVELGVDVSEVWNHDDSELTIAESLHDGVYVRSVYFFDPNGILLELAAWTRPLGPDDVGHEPARASAAALADGAG